VLDHRDVECANVLGYSYGGAVAQQFAYQHPDRIRRLVLAATTCGIGARLGSLRAMSVLATPFRYYSSTYFERIAAATYGGRTGRNAQVRQAMITARRKLPPSSPGYAMQLLAASGWSSWSFLDRIPHESLVISGDDDPLIPVSNARMLAERIPRAQLEIVERAGHLFLLDDPQNVGARISRFLLKPPRHAASRGIDGPRPRLHP
jgi:poly(3-hydroxyoctanoate) depolymerase